MSLLIFCIVVIVVLALVIYGVRNLPITAPFGPILVALCCVVAALLIIQRAGLI